MWDFPLTKVKKTKKKVQPDAHKASKPSKQNKKTKPAKTSHNWDDMKAEPDLLIIAERLQKEWDQMKRNLGKFEIYKDEKYDLDDFADYVLQFNVPAGKKIVPADGTTTPTPVVTRSSIDMLLNLHNTFTQLMHMDPPLDELTTKRFVEYLEKAIPRTDASAFELEVGCLIPFARRASVEEFMEAINTGELASKALEKKKESEESEKGKGKKGKTKADETSSFIDDVNDLVPRAPSPSDEDATREDGAGQRDEFDGSRSESTSADAEEVHAGD